MSNPLLITDSTIDGVLKRIYEKFRVDTFPRLTPLLAQLKKGKPGGPERMRWGGDGIYWDVVLTRPVGMTASPAGYFPPTAAATEKQANVGIKRTYVTREIDALAEAGTRAKNASFINLARKITTEAIDASRLGQQEVLHGTGRGIKGLITVATDTTHIIVESPYGIAGAGRGGLLLDVGMYIAVLDTGSSDAVLGRATITVAANSGDAVTLTLDTAVSGMAVGDKVVPATTSDTSLDNVPNGLQNMLNAGGSFASLHGLDQGTYPRWDTTRLVAGTDTPDANQPTEMDIWELATRVANVSGKDPKTKPGQFLLLTTPGIEKKLAESFLGQRRFQADDKIVLKGGFSAVRIAGLAVVSDFWCPAGVIYLIHLQSLSWVDLMDWRRLVFEGSGPWRFIAGRDAYQVNFGAYWNTAVLRRNAHGIISGYTDTVRYDFVQ